MPESDWQKVCDPKAARILSDPKELRFLEPFIKRECSLAEAAKDLGVKLPALSYRVRRLLAVGLLNLVREELRKGVCVKVYRASSSRYLVPFDMTSLEGVVAILNLQMRSFMPFYLEQMARTMMAEAEGGYIRIVRTADGQDVSYTLRPSTTPPDAVGRELKDIVLGPDTAALESVSYRPTLNFEDAKALQREMHELLARYVGKRGSQAYFLHFALFPVHDKT